ncbi:ion transporter [Tropicimonas sp. TH_r6]|uniref:ion transporter n=1 Tax=Tropicimonas sp. TH_r6 TaxID=3082085 RepID=UPI00295406F5|nr:ion transporter [Tropicimonas sp. TH_r6]MDV7141258.1 ion transporter [Tropicimonas sp. TH_r6]
MRETLKTWLERPKVGNFIIGVILFNAVLLGLETYPAVMNRAGGVIIALDNLCLTIFVLEILAKLIAYRFGFFRNPWNIFDFVIVGIALVPAAHAFSVLRALRILRVLRVISVMPRLRRVVEGFVSALPGMGSVFLLMALVFYIGAVMATKLYGQSFPDWFGSLGNSFYSLFQIMTLESWSMGIVRPVMAEHPGAWAFFVPFILLTTFAVVNLLVGLIVNSMQDAHHEEDVAETGVFRDDVLGRLDEIERLLRQQSGGSSHETKAGEDRVTAP